MAAARFVMPLQVGFGTDGQFSPGSKLFFYEAGTSTPLETYSDADLAIENANPVIANAAGYFGNIFVKDQLYKVILTDVDDVQIFQADNCQWVALQDLVEADTEFFTGNGTNKIFELQWSPEGVESVDVTLDGVDQRPGVDFVVTGANVIFDEAPSSGRKVMVRPRGRIASESVLGIVAVDDIAALRLFPTRPDGILVRNAGVSVGDIYRWDVASTAADDGYLTVKPTSIDPSDPGRWIKINPLYQTVDQSGASIIMLSGTVAAHSSLVFDNAAIGTSTHSVAFTESAIGDGSSYSFAAQGASIGDASGDSIALGSSYVGNTSRYAVAIGGNGTGVGNNAPRAVAIGGSGGVASAPDSVAIGGFAVVASGDNAVAIGGDTLSASGDKSAVLGGTSASASAANAATLGGNAVSAVEANSVVIGSNGGTANAARSAVVGGNDGLTSAADAVVLGGEANTAEGARSVAMGTSARTERQNEVSQGGGSFSVSGDAQAMRNILTAVTTDATPTEMLAGGGRLVLPNDTTWGFAGRVVARRSDADDEGAHYTFTGTIDRNANAASTALLSAVTPVVVDEDAADWDIAVTASTANGALQITVTGQADKTIRWVAMVDIVQVGGA